MRYNTKEVLLLATRHQHTCAYSQEIARLNAVKAAMQANIDEKGEIIVGLCRELVALEEKLARKEVTQ